MVHVQVTEGDLLAKAQQVFGIAGFRPGQRELLATVLGGGDAVGVLPTGGGKSLVYQLASLYRPRPVVVVTPLISSAEDQTDKLGQRRVAATRLDSSLCAAEAKLATTAIAGGKLEFVYVTPERLQDMEFLKLLQSRRRGSRTPLQRTPRARRLATRMLRYAANTSCRTAQILRYFEEHREGECGRCDRCHTNPQGAFSPAASLGS